LSTFSVAIIYSSGVIILAGGGGGGGNFQKRTPCLTSSTLSRFRLIFIIYYLFKLAAWW
jgi:hypothetical protein